MIFTDEFQQSIRVNHQCNTREYAILYCASSFCVNACEKIAHTNLRNAANFGHNPGYNPPSPLNIVNWDEYVRFHLDNRHIIFLNSCNLYSMLEFIHNLLNFNIGIYYN